jgi:hypothetical protein
VSFTLLSGHVLQLEEEILSEFWERDFFIGLLLVGENKDVVIRL